MRKRLTINPVRNGALRVVQVTDTHIAREPGPTDFEGVDTGATLRTVLDAVAGLSPAPDCILLTGDLVDIPSPEAYARVLELFGGCTCPVVSLPGNHDDPVMMRTMLNAGCMSTHSVIDAGHWRIVLLNDYLPRSDGGRLPDHELEFLSHELHRDDTEHVLVCLHHQPVPVGSPWMDAMGLDDPDVLFAVIDADRKSVV